MKTTRTISNIAYNSLNFFEYKMKDLADRGVIEWAYWIWHHADQDDKKDHIHFVLRPSCRLDTTELRATFFEFQADNPLPLAPTSKWFFTNSMDDWLLYVLHDEAYLASKGLKRNYRYDIEAVCATDRDALMADYNAIDRVKFDRLRRLAEAVYEGIPFVNLVQSGLIPVAQRAQWEAQYRALLDRTYKNVDFETGEIKEEQRNDEQIHSAETAQKASNSHS